MSLVPDPPPTLFPRPCHEDDPKLGFQRWEERLAGLTDTDLRGRLEQITAAAASRRLLAAVFAHSPYLTDSLMKEPQVLAAIDDAGYDAMLEGALADLAQRPEGEDRAAAMRRLRLAKRRSSLAIALADLSGARPLHWITAGLSRLAGALLNEALAYLLSDAARRHQLELEDPNEPLRRCGLTALGMGKLGAQELNFSSDVDLIVLYDPERMHSKARQGVDALAQRLTRELVAMVSERTADGYGFRVDLRLRPDPGATPLAVSLNAALLYYESMGQNWERAAMIKARPVAGDLELGRTFLKEIRPFVWRRSLDFLAIQDIHAVKRQIHAVKGGSVVAVEGHDIKLGRGGIREIEFFAQTQQLIWGGREPALRGNRTVDTLHALAEHGHMSKTVAEALEESYGFLRTVEHRIQMVADQQTHRLPADAAGVERLAAFLGYEDPAAFRQALLHHLHRVEDRYAKLFQEDSEPPAKVGSLVFTGDTPVPDTIETLTGLGFAEPERVFTLVRSWHHGRYRATRSTAARERLTLLMPELLQAFGSSADPDAALTAFDTFLSGLPAGVQLFAMLHANPQILDLLASVMGTAPVLAQYLARRPALLDAVLSPDFFEPMPKRKALRQEMEEQLATARSYEEELDCLRRLVHDRRFQAGVRLLLGLDGEETLARRLSDIADAALSVLLERVEREFAQRHGRVPGAEFAVVELGKLGSRELTFTSDLDLVFVYRVPEGAIGSDGEKSLDPTTYYSRFAQRLINATTAPTAEGVLYQIDMRLRPAGNAGPIVCTLPGFLRYHREEAWTWEHMALTRARVMSADAGFGEEVMEAICGILCQERDPEALAADVASMRERLEREKPAKGPWDIKHRRGGLIDCEFLAQYLELRYGHANPDIVLGASDAVFRKAQEKELIEADEAEGLERCLHFLRRIQGYLRLTIGDGGSDADLATAPEAIRRGLARACNALDFGWLEDTLEEVTGYVAEVFDRHITEPARAATSQDQAKEKTG